MGYASPLAKWGYGVYQGEQDWQNAWKQLSKMMEQKWQQEVPQQSPQKWISPTPYGS